MPPDKSPFLAAVPDSEEQINLMRQQRETLQGEISDRQTQVDELNRKIDALNGLRQAYGYPLA